MDKPNPIPPAPPTIELCPYLPEGDAESTAGVVFEILRQRRSVRSFSDRPVSLATIERIVAAAGTAPSGANKQPWQFVAVADREIKRRIREGAEAEERAFYRRRANADWLADLRAIGTDEHKPFLEIAPWLIVVFKLMRDDSPERRTDQVYYVNESVGIACGMLLAAAHMAGLATLTHTPSPMKFLREILGRPAHERPYLLIPIGYPAEACRVPDLKRKPIEEILAVKQASG